MEDKETQLPSLSPNWPLQAASNTILLVYVTARPNLLYIVRFGPSALTVLFLVT
jgi:hypothetical protein